MVTYTYKPSTAKLGNGNVIAPNDHVYVSPPWSERDGNPYTIARIIEFLQPDATPKKGVRNTGELQVRLSLYYRPSDVSLRNISDYRLLLAAIHTDVQPLSNVRGKCYVRHKDRIEDLLEWKRRPDHFYFIKFFDPYIKREFEVIRTETAKNIPANVREALLSRYEYLVTEKEMISDLTDDFRSCCVCEKWAASQDSVRCEVCRKNYHMSCLKPPLQAKPAKGYSWVCLPCTVQRHKDVQAQKYHFSSNGSAPSRPSKSSKAKEKVADQASSNKADVTHRGWPWRYFGLYTHAEDALDPDDQIFPRAATRIGTKYQANVLTWEEQQELEAKHGIIEPEAGPSRHVRVERGHDAEKKYESTITVLSKPSDDLNAYMEEVSNMRLAVPPYDVERLDKAITSYTALGRDRALEAMRSSKLADFSPIHFDEHETRIFEEELEKWGGLEAHETGKVLGKRSAEVLRFSYIWKNKQLKTENEALRQHRKVSHAHARQNKTLGAPSLGKIRGRSESSASDDEVSLFGVPPARVQCAACSTRISDVWWRCPRSLQGKAMCETCGSNWRKYGVISFVKAEDSKKPEKKEREGKRAKGDVSGASTPVPPAPPKLPPCVVCKRMEPKSSMARCKNCTFSAHSGCYGIEPHEMGTDWQCELCAEDVPEETPLPPRCVLCSRTAPPVHLKARGKKAIGEFDMLSALKPTEGNRWAHVLCSAWLPELVYTTPAALKLIEGISNLPRVRWEGACGLCGLLDGAKVECIECNTGFHASCAWLAGHKFGFEISLAKVGKRDTPQIVKFKDETGLMSAVVYCKSHDLEGSRTIYDLHEVDPETNETALQTFAAAYKALPPHASFALLRKAQRLDALVPMPLEASKPKHCGRCGVDVSPMWYTANRALIASDNNDDDVDMESNGDKDDTADVCHLCHWRLSAIAPS